MEFGELPRCHRVPLWARAAWRLKDRDFVTETTFSGLGIAEPLRRALAAANYTQPTPIQAQAIPELLAGKDLLGIAQTGTGKTAAFALPILQRLAETHEPPARRSARVLILAPTRELALQIGESIRAYGRFLGLRHTVVLGGVGLRPQVKALARGVDVLIATPGRLLDLAKQGHVKLQTTTTLVLDEADRMLDMGFINDIRKIVAALPRQRQSLLFSATMPREIAHLAKSILDEPVRVEVRPTKVAVERIDQRVFFVERAGKRDLLVRLLADRELSRVIVFTRTKHGADRLARQLGRSGSSAEALHGNKTQGARQAALARFKDGRSRVLVATDIAARGIDVDGVTHVVNFDLPNEPESYVHRIGRTARAGALGVALSFCAPEERRQLRAIETLTKRPLTAIGERPAEIASAPNRRNRKRKAQASTARKTHATRAARGNRGDRPKSGRQGQRQPEARARAS